MNIVITIATSIIQFYPCQLGKVEKKKKIKGKWFQKAGYSNMWKDNFLEELQKLTLLINMLISLLLKSTCF